MKPKTNPPKTPPPKKESTPLRQRAEETFRVSKAPKVSEKLSRADMQALIHELQVHQVELEMQNEELQRVHAELESVRDKYSNLYDFAPVGYLTLDDRNTIREANLTAALMLGVERARLLRMRFTSFIAPQDQDKFYLFRKLDFDARARQECEARLVKSDGSGFDALLEATAAHDDNAPLLRLAIHDVTERIKAEREIVATRDRLQRVLASINDGFVTFDPQMNYTYVNPKGGELLGRKPENLVGKNYWVEFPEAKGTPFANAYVRALETQETLVIEDYYAPWDRWFENRIYPSKDGLSIFFTEITERKRAEEAIQRNRQQLQAILDHSPSIVFMKDLEGRYLLFNRKWEELFNREGRDLTGKTDFEIFPAELARELRANDRKVVEGRIPITFEESARLDDGVLHTYVSVKFPLFDLNGAPYALCGISTDITARKQAEEQLRESQRQLVAIIGNLPGVVYRARNDRDWTTEFVSEGILPLTGYPVSDFMEHRREFGDRIHADDRKRVWDEIQSALGARRSYELTYRIAAAGGAEKWVWERGGGVYDPHGTLLALEGFVTDITERKRAEQELRFTRDLFLTTFHASPLASVLATLTERRIVDVNTAWEEMFGYARAESLGKQAADFDFWADPSKCQQAYAALLQAGRLRDFEFEFKNKSGEKGYALFNTEIIEQRGEKYLLSQMMNITERKRAEDALRESEEKFSTLFEKAPYSIVLSSLPDGVIVHVNEAFEQALGFSRQEAIGKTSLELAFNPDAEVRARALAELKERGFVHNLELTLRTKSGQARLFSINIDLVTIGGEKYILNTSLDITERKRAEEEIHRRAEQQAALYVLGRRVASSLSVEGVMEAVLEEILRVVTPDLAMFFMRQGKDMFLRGSHAPADGLRHDETPVHRVSECLCGLAAKEAQAIYSTDIHTDLRCTWMECKRAGVTSFAALPLRTENEVLGVIGLASKDKRDFRAIAAFLETLADQAALGLKNARLLEETRLNNDRLAELSRRLVETRESEARAIGRELHDQFGQILTAMKITLDLAGQLPADAAAAKIGQAQTFAADLLDRVSRLSLQLRPPMLDDLGLIPALTWQVNRFQEETGVAVEFEHRGVEGIRFTSEIETTAYRVAQESLTNVARHSRGTRVRLEVQKRGAGMEIQIEDDGVGFDPVAALALNRGLGGMRERVQLVGGTFEIESAPGKGSRKTMRLPWKERA